MRDVTVRFGGLVAVGWRLVRSACRRDLRLIGPNGAGKTTLFNAVSGNVVANGGSIRFRGEEIAGLTPHEISARGARRTFQNGGLFPELTALENVLVGLHAQVGSGFFGLLFGRRSAAAELISDGACARPAVGDGHRTSSPIRRRARSPAASSAWWRSCARSPPIRRCCCSTNRRSASHRRRAGNLPIVIRDLARTRDIGILLIEHAIELVMSVADRVIVLNDGRKVADAPPEQVRADRAVLEAYLGHA